MEFRRLEETRNTSFPTMSQITHYLRRSVTNSLNFVAWFTYYQFDQYNILPLAHAVFLYVSHDYHNTHQLFT
jgi:hypothetical protein